MISSIEKSNKLQRKVHIKPLQSYFVEAMFHRPKKHLNVLTLFVYSEDNFSSNYTQK